MAKASAASHVEKHQSRDVCDSASADAASEAIQSAENRLSESSAESYSSDVHSQAVTVSGEWALPQSPRGCSALEACFLEEPSLTAAAKVRLTSSVA